MRPLLLVLLALSACAHRQTRDDSPGAGGGISLSSSAVAQAALAQGMGVGGLKSINGGPNEHSTQDMTAKSITLSAASAANAVVVTQGAKVCTNGATCTRALSDNGTDITLSGPLNVNSGNSGIRASGYGISNNAANTIGIGLGGTGIEYRSISASGSHVFQAASGASTYATIGPGSAGTITLSGGGTGTATVTSGMRCVCTDTTANASVKCAVSATTLTATGTANDVIAYLCL